METIADRLLKFTKNQGYSNYYIEKKLLLSNGHFGKILKTPMPSHKIIEKFSHTFPELNKNWLLTGEGEMINEGCVVKEFREHIRFTKEQFSNKTGIELAVLEQIEEGKHKLKHTINEEKIKIAFNIFEEDIEKYFNSIKKDTIDIDNWQYILCNKKELQVREDDYLKKRFEYYKEVKKKIQNNNSYTEFVNEDNPQVKDQTSYIEKSTNPAIEIILKNPPIPLVDTTAVAGFGNENFSLDVKDVKDYYVIPKFANEKVDFMIEIKGSSMYPKYNSGDIVACTIIKDSAYIQWNKTHVIATKYQGIMVKRIKEGKTEEFLKMISDNSSYDPFEIPVSEITGIAIVVGVVRLE